MDTISLLLHSAHINPGLYVAFRYYHCSMQPLNMDGLMPSDALMHISRYKCSCITAISKQVWCDCDCTHVCDVTVHMCVMWLWLYTCVWCDCDWLYTCVWCDCDCTHVCVCAPLLSALSISRMCEQHERGWSGRGMERQGVAGVIERYDVETFLLPADAHNVKKHIVIKTF